MLSLLKKPGAWIPVAIPLAFFTYLVTVISVYGIVREEDEGIGAHLFQLWLVLEPFMLGYFAFKYVPQARNEAVIILGLQILAALLPIATVFSLGL